MEERITRGMSLKLVDTSGFTEIVTLAQVKELLNINFVTHDAKLTSLIVACRQVFEDVNNISLISRLVNVSWIELYDNEVLPYGPVNMDIEDISVKDMDDNVLSITEFKIIGQGNSHIIIGDFPNGLKLSYDAGYALDAANVPAKYKQALINAVADVFLNDISISESVIKHCKV